MLRLRFKVCFSSLWLWFGVRVVVVVVVVVVATFVDDEICHDDGKGIHSKVNQKLGSELLISLLYSDPCLCCQGAEGYTFAHQLGWEAVPQLICH